MDAKPPTLYFGYGSNLWLAQMTRRCPGSQYQGIALLPDWKWIINSRHYANVIPSTEDEVWGLVYTLTADDEDKLDGYEGVPDAYIKKTMPVQLDRAGKRQVVEALVYVDEKRLTPDEPYAEYIDRMNCGIHDAVAEGVPPSYVDRYLRPFIPGDEKGPLEQVDQGLHLTVGSEASTTEEVGGESASR
ncbi:MAG: hypothetical protein M1833_002242 [Piccolia ochrophora]|nr:MAG: hypothetical protein M1833_002242 [Piccolia ochrophora]